MGSDFDLDTRATARAAADGGDAGRTRAMHASLPWSVAQRYSRPIPRYTSYPPAPAWQPVTEGLVREAFARAAEDTRPLSFYVHIPFCERMCLYCGCNVVVARTHERVPSYLAALQRELEGVARTLGNRQLAQLHFGGGTPTFLKPSELEEIIIGIFEKFPPREDAELGIEIDPMVTSREHLEILRRLGFNRISIGVQDFDERVQTIIERRQPESVSRASVALARELGFGSINVDLVYGLPGQNVDNLRRSAEIIGELAPDRVAMFGYAHVPHMRPQQKQLEKHGIPTPEQRWEMYHTTARTLIGGGYEPIGMDHFARSGDELARAARDGRLHRNFQGYTVLAPTDLVGLGVTAISDVSGTFLQNRHRLPEYTAAIGSGASAAERGLRLSDEDELRRFVILRIMCNLLLRYDEIENRFHLRMHEHFARELEALAPLEADGLVTRYDDRLVVTELGRPLVRNVAVVFDAYAPPPEAASGRFSNAI